MTMRLSFVPCKLFFAFFFNIFIFVLSAQAESTEAVVDRQDAQVWLKKIQSSASKLNYSGIFVYQQANHMQTSRISHIWDGKNDLEKLEILDGKPREYIRKNDEITCYVPETKTVFVEKRVTRDMFPAMFAASPAAIAEHYAVKKAGIGRIAGFDCQIVELVPKDNLRYGYRLWAEKSTGLLLRAQTLNHNNVIEQIAFTQISIGDIDRNRIKSNFNTATGWRFENAVMSQASLTGWSVMAMPSGFKKTREMKRLVSDSSAGHSVSTKGAESSQREVSQIVYSDGLAAISVFIEPNTENRTEGSVQQGALNIAGRRQGDFWITVVGEVPAMAIKQVVNSIEFTQK